MPVGVGDVSANLGRVGQGLPSGIELRPGRRRRCSSSYTIVNTSVTYRRNVQRGVYASICWVEDYFEASSTARCFRRSACSTRISACPARRRRSACGCNTSSDEHGGGGASAPSSRVLRKVSWRLIPLLFLCYIVAYLDRVNVGFAKLQMQDALQFSEAVYGLGAGIFFIGYFIFEVPSNVILAQGGRTPLDRTDHDHLGPVVGGHDVRELADGVLRDPLLSRCGRSGLFPRHHPVPHLLVSGARIVHANHPRCS